MTPRIPLRFTRRTLIKYALAAALPVPALAGVPPTLERTGPVKKVVMIGAGLAGLSAAYELTQAGHEVTVLEASSRAGGRVYTLREPFSDGMYAEAGAIYLPAAHEYSLRYARLFHLPLDEVDSRASASFFYLRGKLLRGTAEAAAEWPLDLAPWEKGLDPLVMLDKYAAAVLKRIGDPSAPGWPPDSLKPFDQVTLTEFLHRQGASADAIALIKLTYLNLLGDGLDAVSALCALRELFLFEKQVGQPTYVIRGGMDLLPGAFASHLGGKIHYRSPVVRLEHSTEGVRVTFLQEGQPHVQSADHCICCVPFSLLRQIEVSPPFSPVKTRAIQDLPYTSVTRIYLQSRRRFWLKEAGSVTTIATDLPVMWTRDATFNQPGVRGILESYMAGPHAREAAALKENERITFALIQMEKVYPGIRAHFEAGASYSWDNNQWSRGDYAWFKPGQVAALLPAMRQPEGRVHFAGEHTSAWLGWMQGALESGLRAAAEVNQRQ